MHFAVLASIRSIYFPWTCLTLDNSILSLFFVEYGEFDFIHFELSSWFAHSTTERLCADFTQCLRRLGGSQIFYNWASTSNLRHAVAWTNFSGAHLLGECVGRIEGNVVGVHSTGAGDGSSRGGEDTHCNLLPLGSKEAADVLGAQLRLAAALWLLALAQQRLRVTTFLLFFVRGNHILPYLRNWLWNLKLCALGQNFFECRWLWQNATNISERLTTIESSNSITNYSDLWFSCWYGQSL